MKLFKRSLNKGILITLIIICGLLIYLAALTFINPLEIKILIPIILFVVGFSLMVTSLFFYKKGIVYWGLIFVPHIKADRTKNPKMFWFWLIVYFVISLIIIAMGFYALFYVIIS